MILTRVPNLLNISEFIVFIVFRSAKRRYEVLDGSKDKGLCLIFDALVHVEGGAERASTAHKISCGTIQIYCAPKKGLRNALILLVQKLKA